MNSFKIQQKTNNKNLRFHNLKIKGSVYYTWLSTIGLELGELNGGESIEVVLDWPLS